MPAQPAWFLRLPAIRAAVAAVETPVLDRDGIEQLFGVRRRRAIELLHRFGGYQTGKTFLVDRGSLLAQLELLEHGAEFRREKARRRRVSEDVEQAKVSMRARAVAIPAPRGVDGMPGVRLAPGELRIVFEGVEDLLRQLMELAIGIQSDLPRFEALCEEKPTGVADKTQGSSI